MRPQDITHLHLLLNHVPTIGTVVGRTMVRKGADLDSTVRPFVGTLGPGEPVLGLSIRF